MLRTFILFNCFWMLCNCSYQPTTTKVLLKKINETVYASGNLIITHDQEFASNCDQIIEMEDSKIISA